MNMEKKGAISRRKFLVGIIAASGLSFLGGNIYSGKRIGRFFSDGLKPSEAEIKHYLKNLPEATKKIGREYIQNKQGEDLEEELFNDFYSRFTKNTISGFKHFNVNEMLMGIIQDDYRHNRIVYINNWVFSQMEARLCGLAFVLSK